MCSEIVEGSRTRAPLAILLDRWPLVTGLCVLGVPVLVQLAEQAWTLETGVHGPLILATWLWLLYRGFDENRVLIAPGRLGLALAVIVPALIFFIATWAFDFISLYVAAAVVIVIAVLYLELGPAVSRAMWFPMAYGVFLIPPPGYAVDVVTLPIKTVISNVVTGVLSGVGYPIVRSGVSLYISQYQLLVEDACSGLQSLFSLMALGLFYVYLMHRSEWRYALVLALFIIPAAIFANFVRVMAIVLMTYYFGDETAQGFLHTSTGMLLFVVTLLSVFVLDRLLAPLRERLSARGAA